MDGMISFKQLERIYSNDTSRLKFIRALQHFLLSKRDIISPGILEEVPVYSGKPVDLYELFHQVDRREGFDKVNLMNRWQEITDVMKLPSTALSLRECYVKYLRLFEEAIRKKAQQQHQSHQQQQQLHLQQQHLQQQQMRSHEQSNPTLAPRPPARPLDTVDLSTMPPQKRPRPEIGAGPAPVTGTPQPPNSNLARQAVQRTQSVPSQQMNPNSYSMTPANMSTTSNGSIVVSTIHINSAIKSLLSVDQNSIKQGLNYLMQLSLEGDNSRNILFVEKYPTIITALGTLLDTINPFTKLLFTLTSNELLDPAFNISQYLLSGNDRADIFWNQTNPLDHDNVLQAIARTLDTNTLLISALCIIRNLSFEMANVQMIAYSAPIMQHLVALLLIASSPTTISLPVSVPYVYRSRNPALTQASSYSLDTLYHIAKHIDITGTVRVGGVADDCWLRDTLTHLGTERDSLKVYLTEHMSAVSTGKYVAATSFLFPALLRCITESYERDITRRCLGIFTKLTAVPSNTHIFAQKCPESTLSLLVQLLCTNITSSESIRVYYPPAADSNQFEAHSAMVSGLPIVLLDRLPAATGDFNEFSDIEIRDMVLDALRSLCSHADLNTSSATGVVTPQSSFHLETPLSSADHVSLKERIAAQPLCLQLLIQILSSSVGRLKTEGFHRAISLLSLLSMNPKNHKKFLSVQKSLCCIAMSDEAVAEAVMNSTLRNIVQNNYNYVGEVHAQDD